MQIPSFQLNQYDLYNTNPLKNREKEDKEEKKMNLETPPT
jgi:hypothetical protein